MVSICEALAPDRISNFFTLLARRCPSAKLYSLLPRSSALPSTRTFALLFLLRYSPCACTVARSLGCTASTSNGKNTLRFSGMAASALAAAGAVAASPAVSATGAVAVCADSAAPVAGAAVSVAAEVAAGSLTASFGFSVAQAASRLTNTILRISFFIVISIYLLFKERSPDRLAYITALSNHLLLHSAIAGYSRQYTTTLRLGREQDQLAV